MRPTGLVLADEVDCRFWTDRISNAEVAQDAIDAVSEHGRKLVKRVVYGAVLANHNDVVGADAEVGVLGQPGLQIHRGEHCRRGRHWESFDALSSYQAHVLPSERQHPAAFACTEQDGLGCI